MHRHIILLFLTSPACVFAQADAKVPDPDPELERKSFIVAPGFEVNLFASDPLLAKPIQMNFDPQGRLWVASSEVYPQIKPGQVANDKIVILEDTKGVGKADKVTVFADGLLIPTGVAPGDGGAYVANSTEIVHLSASKPGHKADRVDASSCPASARRTRTISSTHSAGDRTVACTSIRASTSTRTSRRPMA